MNMDAPLQLLCTNLDYDEHKGRIAIGRITSGRVNKAETVVVCKPGAPAGNAEGGIGLMQRWTGMESQSSRVGH